MAPTRGDNSSPDKPTRAPHGSREEHQTVCKSTLWPSTVVKLLHCHFPALCSSVSRNCAECILPEQLTTSGVLALECHFRSLAKAAHNHKGTTPCLTSDRPDVTTNVPSECIEQAPPLIPHCSIDECTVMRLRMGSDRGERHRPIADWHPE